MNLDELYKLETPYDRLNRSGESEGSFLVLEGLLKAWFNSKKKPVEMNNLQNSCACYSNMDFLGNISRLVSRDYAETSGNFGTGCYVSPTPKGVLFYELIYATDSRKVDWKHKELRPLSEF